MKHITGNPFNYRCPKCGSADDVVIDAYLSIWMSSKGPHLIQTKTPPTWHSTDTANCYACDFTGTVEDFQTTAQIIPLRTHRR